MNVGRFAAFSRTALSRPLLSGTKKLAAQQDVKIVQDILVRKFSAYASIVAAGHSRQEPSSKTSDPMANKQANVQLELGLKVPETDNSGAVLELDLDELAEAVQLFQERRALVGLSGGEEALHAMTDQLAERASALYFNELDSMRIQTDPSLSVIFKRLADRRVLVLCPPPLQLQPRSVGAILEA
jgi:hypothetical protein